MQITANTHIVARIIAALRAAPTARSAPESFSVLVPGEGPAGTFATVAEAERALHRLPCSARRNATICDQDGYCVVR